MTKDEKEQAKRHKVIRRWCEECRYKTKHFVVWDSAKLDILVCAGCERLTLQGTL